jgi:hypothetical protein
MNGSDARERLIAAFVNDALVRALFDNLSGPEKWATIEKALTHLPPEPDRLQDPPTHQAWSAAQQELKRLGGR